MSIIIEETSETPTSVGRLLLLLAVPAIALTVMAVLTLQQDTQGRKPAAATEFSKPLPVTSAPSTAGDGSHTLYILGGDATQQHVVDLDNGSPTVDWYAYVSTPEEEAALMQAREQADWFRYASGLPLIRVVDLRPVPAQSPSSDGGGPAQNR